MVDKVGKITIIPSAEVHNKTEWGAIFISANHSQSNSFGTWILSKDRPFCRGIAPTVVDLSNLQQAERAFFVMSTSKLQDETRERLKVLLKGCNFIENYRPDWLRNPETGYPLEFDFWFPENQIAIEVQGRQHYEYVPRFHGSIEDFNKQVERDQYKRDFCQDKGIHLCEICTPDEIDRFINDLALYSGELHKRLFEKSIRIKWLSFAAAEIIREAGKALCNPGKIEGIMTRMERVGREYGIPIKEIKPDFGITKFHLAFPTKPIVEVCLKGQYKKTIKRTLAAVMSIDPEAETAILRWHNQDEVIEKEQFMEKVFSLKNGSQVERSEYFWWTKVEKLKKAAKALGWKVS